MKNYRYGSRYQSRFKPRYQSRFQIVVSDYSSSTEEWKRALEAPESELPPLTDQQREIARRFGVSQQEYARGVLAGRYGNQRMRKRAQALGEHAQEILGGLGARYKVLAVLWEGSKLRWMLRIETPERVVGVPVPFELADDVIDSGVLQEIERLKRLVLAGVKRPSK
jgi:hypothetical protein